MSNAQDQAFMARLQARGLLGPEQLADLARWRGGDPLAQRVLGRRLLPGPAVAEVLRELAQGAWVCQRCAERWPYYHLASQRLLCCGLCGGALEFLANPRPRRRRAGLGTTRRERLELPGSLRASASELTPARGAAPAPAARSPQAEPLGPGERPALRRRLGPYRLEAELGRGAHGVVYRTRDREGRPLALKLLHPFLPRDGETVARFRQEAAVARRLRHPGIVPVLELGVLDGCHYFTMPLCPGETLAARLRRGGALPPRSAARLIAGLARAVAAAHAAGVVHRDLKPANVLLDPSGTARITDFGVARDEARASALTRTGDILGTPAYMAPEQFEGEGVGPRSDVWALGTLLFECLTGSRPFAGATLLALAHEVCTRDAPAPGARRPGLPGALDRICARALAREPSRRTPSAVALAEELEAWLRRTRAGAGPPPAS